MVSCVFCAIAKGLSEAHVIYKDSDFIAFLDKYPVTRGHTLIATIEHYVNILDIPDEKVARAFTLAKKIALAQTLGLGAKGVKIVMHNNREAGQEIMHAHIHVIPYGVPARNRATLTREEGEEVARILREALSQ